MLGKLQEKTLIIFVQCLKTKVRMCDEYKIVIPTLEGIICATYDDYVTQRVKGEIYPCKKTYLI